MESNEIEYKIEKPEEPVDPENPDIKLHTVSGQAWLDRNEDGRKDFGEERLAGIRVILIDEKTGETAEDIDGNKLETSTNSSGEYKFENVIPGKYQVVFDYDSSKYGITEYQKQGINKANNSDVIVQTIELNGEKRQVAITATLEIEDENFKDIDAGFVVGKVFDIKLEKMINKIIIQNNLGTTVRQYSNTNIAKIEIDRKQISSSNIIIEYAIRLTNEGELAGYINEIVDYIPSDLNFSSEINKNWYQGTDRNLYSKELTNDILNPGESKTINLTLTKQMNEENLGTIINTAEISGASNDYLIKDKDSTPGNKIQGEDDISKAELIVSLRTGSAVMYTGLVFTIAVIIGVGIYFINKKVLKED